MKVKLKAIRLGKSQLIVLIQGRKYVKKALPEVIDVLYAEAEALFKAKNNATAIKKFIARINPDYRLTTDDGLFQRDDLGKYYLTGYPVVVPTTLLEAIRTRIRSGADHSYLIEFWKLLMINPDAEVRNHLFDWCSGSETGFEITSAGYLLGYVRCQLNHNISVLERYIRSEYRVKSHRDHRVFLNTSGMYSDRLFNQSGVDTGIVGHLFRDLFQDAFSKVREAQSTVFRTQRRLSRQLQIGQTCSEEVMVQGVIEEKDVNKSEIIVMVMLNPAHVNKLTPAGTQTLECFPYGAVQLGTEEEGFKVVGETLMEVDYMQQDFYRMQALLEEAQSLVGGRTILLTPAEIKRILDSRKIFIDETKKK